MDRERVYGVEVEPLLPGEIATEVIVLTQVLTEDGATALSLRHSDGLSGSWQRIGMLTAALDVARKHSVDSFRPDRPDDE